MSNNEKVLVCGGTRQQGMSLVNGLILEGYDVTVANRHDKTELFNGRVNQIVLDRSNEESMKNALNGKEYDYIIDTCAYNGQYVKYLLDNVKTNKYIQYSSNAVYGLLHWNIKEEEYNPKTFNLQNYSEKNQFLTTGDFNYQIGKRSAENFIYNYKIPELIVRIPYVSGRNDCSKRIEWFINKIINNEAIEVREDYLNKEFAMTHESEAGKFILHAMKNNLQGIYNTASDGSVTVMDIIGRIEKTLGKYAKFKFGNENHCHYNTVPEHSMNTDKAKATGYKFMNIDDWLWDTIDYFCYKLKKR